MMHALLHALWAPVIVVSLAMLAICFREGGEAPAVATALVTVFAWLGGFALLMFLSACSTAPTAPARDANRLTDCTLTGGAITKTPAGALISVSQQWHCPDGSEWVSQWGDSLPPIYRGKIL